MEKQEKERQQKEEEHKRDMEKQEKERELLRKEKEEEHRRELEKRDKDMEMIKLKMTMGKDQTEGVTQNITIHRPKLPKFEEERDNMDTYLQRFEKFAKTQKWDHAEWTTYLCALLTGKALEVYTSMPRTDVDDYNELKNALLKRYQLTEEGFRRKFREEKPDQGETVYQFIARIRRYLERWVDLAGIDKTYESVMDLLVREQYISTCSEEMAIFLKERIPKNVKEMTIFAERYVEAHERKYKSDDTDGQKSTTKAASAKQMETKSDNSAIERTQYRTRQCFICGRHNHIARDCFYRERDWRYSGYQSKTDHESRYAEENNKGNPIEHRTEVKFEDNTERSNEDTMQQGFSFQVSESKSENNNNVNMKAFVCQGLVNGNEVQFLRDTGCTTAAVKKSLVEDHQFTGNETLCTLIDGTVMKYPLARIHINTPYYVGTIDVMCMDRPIYDFVLGNVYNVRSEPDHKGKSQACGIVYRERASLKHGDVSDKHMQGGRKEAHWMTNRGEMYREMKCIGEYPRRKYAWLADRNCGVSRKKTYKGYQ